MTMGDPFEYEPVEEPDDDRYCDCGALHTIDEIDSGVCDACGKWIDGEEYS